MSRKHKIIICRIVISAVLLAVAAAVKNDVLKICIYFADYIIIGYDIVFRSAKNIKRGQIFDENFLMTVATFGALATKEYAEAVFVMLFYQLGELFQQIAVGKSRQSVSDLMDICPEYANIEIDGKLTQIDPEDLKIGDVITVKSGEKIPIDGTVVSGSSYVNTSNLTGESKPLLANEGTAVISGCINNGGILKVRVDKEFSDSTVCKILELVENTASNKAVTENFVTKFAKYYTPIVVICAAVLAFIVPIFAGNFTAWVQRALSFLVISCPCALVISVPLSFFGGIGCASRNGILIKGSNFIEVLAKCSTAVFDKTGTLTTGSFAVVETKCAQGVSKEELIETAAYAEYYSNHPIAVAIKNAYSGEINQGRVSDCEEIAGMGMKLKINGSDVLAGNAALMKKNGIAVDGDNSIAAAVYVAKDNKYMGELLIADTVKPEAKAALRALHNCGIKKTVMLTGDRKEVAEETGKKLGVDTVLSQLLPADKVREMENVIAKSPEKESVLYVGDGVNDAPVLSRADVGIAMGALGSDAAIEAADVVIMNDSILKIADAIKISKRTLGIVKQNIVFSLFVKAVVLILGACGIAGMWEAVFADVGVSVIAIINAMRCLKYKSEKIKA